MKKRVMALVLTLALIVGVLPAMSFVSEPEVVGADPFVMPSHNGKTNNVTYTLGAGTDAEVPVYVDFRSTSMNPTQSLTPKYIMVHNTGTYVGTANAKNVHNNTNKTSTSACWHYTVDNTSIYQGLADNRRGWHAATSRSTTPSNINAIGIETCVNNFPATETFGGEQWSDGTAILNWYKNQFDKTMKHTAYLCVVLCKRWNLDWRTAIVQHWDSWQYSESSKSGKDCPMQMRATYNEASNTFKAAGTYSNGRNGYGWQIFWSYVEAYANGAKNVGDTNLTSATKIGTYQVNSADGLNVRNEPTTTGTTVIHTLSKGDIVEVLELNGNWGKIQLEDGTYGWCSIANYGTYIGIDALAYGVETGSEGISYSFGADGGLTVVNNSADQGQLDFKMPLDIGTTTTPMLSLQMTPLTGSGYYFGITQTGSGYWMMRDCQSGDQLVVENSAPYMTNTEKLQISVREWWKPEDGYRINQVRLYVAPNSSVKIDYLYFASAQDMVIDSRYNLRSADTNVNLLNPATLSIADRSKPGKFVYSNGMLTLTADTAAGFDVVFKPNMEFDVNVLKRLLVAVEAHTPYNISMTVTRKDGTGTVSLLADYWPSFAAEAPTTGYLPAWNGTAGLDLYNYYAYNNVIPDSGKSVISEIRISLGGQGTTYINSLQLAENDRILLFRDGLYKEDTATGVVEPEPPVFDNGDVNGDGKVSTVDARTIVSHIVGVELISEDMLKYADFDGDGAVSTTDVREILSSIVV
ncbi:MAG: N-acetylmuramoyl-L-alanine amidase [Clostridia bacterium]|nr:N-acetylmuramoyl-L-alanine amidase [Clostridia bacterium]